MEPKDALQAELEELREWAASGQLPQATRAELKRHVEILTSPQALEYLGPRDHPHILDTVRSLLVAKIADHANRVDAIVTEEMQNQTRRSRVMTVMAVILVLGIIVGGYIVYQRYFPPAPDTAAMPAVR